MSKESANGRVARWLAGDERVAVLTSGRGRKWRMGKYFQPLPPFIGEEERERVWAGPTSQQRMPALSRTGKPRGAHRCPLFRVTDWWAAVGVFKRGVSRFG
jgi:hypothetical protein